MNSIFSVLLPYFITFYPLNSTIRRYFPQNFQGTQYFSLLQPEAPLLILADRILSIQKIVEIIGQFRYNRGILAIMG